MHASGVMYCRLEYNVHPMLLSMMLDSFAYDVAHDIY